MKYFPGNFFLFNPAKGESCKKEGSCHRTFRIIYLIKIYMSNRNHFPDVEGKKIHPFKIFFLFSKS
ncbi:MAG: hypothetical protein D4R97_03570 [Bacteroidetes bacterium]|nr:MAG: hypothetical protein D4R97_03570 [Bacteroidota bacterium]